MIRNSRNKIRLIQRKHQPRDPEFRYRAKAKINGTPPSIISAGISANISATCIICNENTGKRGMDSLGRCLACQKSADLLSYHKKTGTKLPPGTLYEFI